ncbi:hypothetical protein [Nostoc piscinale]|uniref:hypothetical protein n=1 Tax=Nostoc piscinale TaxID=224012 RepID=UPI000AAE1095|nr:hypothetical protein [Nostoc piscinale]
MSLRNLLTTDTTRKNGNIYFMLFTRTELEVLTVQQLKTLCWRYGLRPLASGAYKDNYISALMAFPLLAIQQMDDGEGLKLPTFEILQHLGTILDQMGQPSDHQAALIKASLEGKYMNPPQRWYQEKLLNRYHAKHNIEQAITLLSIQ